VVFSQQLILAEGGFKIKLDTPYAINGWPLWMEVYDLELDWTLRCWTIEKQKPKRKFVLTVELVESVPTTLKCIFSLSISSNGWGKTTTMKKSAL
jgi:hypothetical protein